MILFQSRISFWGELQEVGWFLKVSKKFLKVS